MKLRGAWRRDYSEFFDTQEALLIDAMDNADSIYTVFARLQSLAVKCGCAGKLLLHESVPYTDEMLAAVTKKTVPAFRQCVQPLVQLGLVICEDGIYAIADWEFNQNAPAIDAMREGNRSRKAQRSVQERAVGTSASEKKRETCRFPLPPTQAPRKPRMSKATGLSRVTINKYLSELPACFPPCHPGRKRCAEGGRQCTRCTKCTECTNVHCTKWCTNWTYSCTRILYNNLYTPQTNETAGSTAEQAENGDVQNLSRPKNIDDRYKNTSTSTAIADGEGATGSGIPTREEVRSHFAEMGFAVDPDRFFDVNEGRGWRTNSGKPVDDWKKLAAVWDRNERPKDATPPARTEPKANAVGKIPSVEEVMAKWGCDRGDGSGIYRREHVLEMPLRMPESLPMTR